jgi:hypothetical protein
MLTTRELQNRVLEILPTYKEDLRNLEEQLITCGEVDYWFLECARPGIHIFGEDRTAKAKKGATYVAIDYIPSTHILYFLREKPIEHRQGMDGIVGKGSETCPLCGRPLPISLSHLLQHNDLALVGCPELREGITVVDVLPIFSTTLVSGSLTGSLGIPYQRSGNALTRVSPLV